MNGSFCFLLGLGQLCPNRTFLLAASTGVFVYVLNGIDSDGRELDCTCVPTRCSVIVVD